MVRYLEFSSQLYAFWTLFLILHNLRIRISPLRHMILLAIDAVARRFVAIENDRVAKPASKTELHADFQRGNQEIYKQGNCPLTGYVLPLS